MNRNERMALVAAKLRETSFYKMPASTQHHSNFEGGLLDHSTCVWLNLEKLTSALDLQWQDPSSPFIIAMLHDACKIDAYWLNPDYKVWERNENHPDGHGDLSLRVAEQLGIELTDEEKACIRWHMGAFDQQINWDKFTEAIHQYPNVLWTHVADMIAAHVDELYKDVPRCCICGEPLGDYGNNPWPVKEEGECCGYCNFTVVLPARLSGGQANEK